MLESQSLTTCFYTQEATLTDPGLLQRFSTFKSYKTSKATYPSIRTFYRPHSQADKLPNKPTPLPLLVFVHGLGGCLASFNPLLTSLINIAPCLGIDFPGCGRSAFSPTSWDAYTPNALAELLQVVIKQHCSTEDIQGVVLIGHSMGCSLSLLVATSQLAPQNKQRFELLSLIGICPQSTPPSGKVAQRYTQLLRIPTWIFDIVRTLDRRQGLDSASVTQFTGKGSDLELRRIQLKYNRQSRTPVFRRMAWGALSRLPDSSTVVKGLPSLDSWSRLKVPLFLVAGEGDTVTKPEEVTKIAQALGRVNLSSTSSSKSSNVEDLSTNGHVDRPSSTEKSQSLLSTTEVTVFDDTRDPHLQLPEKAPTYSRKRQVLKTSILPSPASHALLYDPSTYRTLAGLIQTFLSDHVDERLSLGWQLQHLSTEGKWDVKNLAKWQAIQPVSEPIAGIFRAMKTLREIDDSHCPDKFVKEWKGRLRAVVDISHESPVYDPKGLDKGGIEYHKFPTVSKIPPTEDEVKDFINLIDKLRDQPPLSSDNADILIGVHCHYGFNRTGFFICCYLIEREKYGVQQAIDAFAQGRPKGIKHAHFLDQLFVRYCVGLKRAATL